MNSPITGNSLKELIYFAGVLLLVAGVVWRLETNAALNNQKQDMVIEELIEVKDEQRTSRLALNEMKIEITRIATLVDRADGKGLLGQTPSRNFLSTAAPRIAAITPTPAPTPQPVVYQTTITTNKAAGESATPTPAPTPTPQATPIPERCLLGLICV